MSHGCEPDWTRSGDAAWAGEETLWELDLETGQARGVESIRGVESRSGSGGSEQKEESHDWVEVETTK